MSLFKEILKDFVKLYNKNEYIKNLVITFFIFIFICFMLFLKVFLFCVFKIVLSFIILYAIVFCFRWVVKKLKEERDNYVY